MMHGALLMQHAILLCCPALVSNKPRGLESGKREELHFHN